MRDHYKVLGVSEVANSAEIKEAYRKLAFEFHPDRNPGNLNSAEMLKMINQAYEVLSDPQKRRSYDQSRGTIVSQKRSEIEPVPIQAKDNEFLNYFRFAQLQQENSWPKKKYVLAIDAVLGFLVLAAIVFTPIPSSNFNVAMEATWMDHLASVGFTAPILAFLSLYILFRKKRDITNVKFIYGILKISACYHLIAPILSLTTNNRSLNFLIIILCWHFVSSVYLILMVLDQSVGQ